MATILQNAKGGMIPFPLALIFAVILDALDFALVGLIPLLGLAIDIFGAIIVFLAVGIRYVAFTMPEFVDVATLSIPVLLPIELLPSYTVAILLGKWKVFG